MEPSTFSPLSLFFLTCCSVDLLLTLIAETLKIAFACSPFVDGLRGESNGEIFPESSSSHERVPNRQIAAVGKLLSTRERAKLFGQKEPMSGEMSYSD